MITGYSGFNSWKLTLLIHIKILYIAFEFNFSLIKIDGLVKVKIPFGVISRTQQREIQSFQ